MHSFCLDNDNKTLNSDISSAENSNNSLPRIFQPTSLIGTKHIDVKI